MPTKPSANLGCMGWTLWELLQTEGVESPAAYAALLADAADVLAMAIGLPRANNRRTEPTSAEEYAIKLRPRIAELVAVLRSAGMSWRGGSPDEKAQTAALGAIPAGACVPRARVTRLLNAIGRMATCNGPHCGATVYFIRHINGRRGIYNPDGTSHFMTCPDGGRFRRDPMAPPPEAKKT